MRCSDNHWIHISTMRVRVNKVIYEYNDFPLKAFVKKYVSPLCFRHCSRDIHFVCSRMLVILPVSYQKFLVANLAERFCNFSGSSWRVLLERYQTDSAYSRTGCTSPLCAIPLHPCGKPIRFRSGIHAFCFLLSKCQRYASFISDLQGI